MKSYKKYFKYFDFYKDKSFRKYNKNALNKEERDMWNLDVYLAGIIYPRLCYFKKHHSGWPAEFKSDKEWKEILDKMIYSFESILNEAHSDKRIPYDRAQVQEGLELFGKYFRALWD